MQQRGPHRFFIGLLAISVALIHAAPGSAAGPHSATPTLSVGIGTNTNRNTDPAPPIPIGIGTSTNSSVSVGTDTSSSTTKHVSSMKATGDVLLCNDADPGHHRPAGYGFPAMKWPVIELPAKKADSTWNSKVSAYIKEWESKTVDSDSFNRVHRAFATSTQPGAPSLEDEEQYRVLFFVRSFGAVVGDSPQMGGVPQICYEYKKVLVQMKEFELASAASNAPAEINSCEGSFRKTQEMLQRAQTAVKTYSDKVEAVLAGSAKYTDKAGKEHVGNLETLYLEGRRKDFVKYRALASSHKLSAADMQALQNEIMLAWGKASERALADTTKVDPSGTYAQVLLQTRAERERARELLKKLGDFKSKMQERTDTCRSLAGGLPAAVAKKTGPNPTITGKIKPPGGTGSGSSSAPPGPGKDPSADPDAGKKPPPTPDLHPPSTDTPPPGGGGAEPPPPYAGPSTSAAGTFLKDNWMWLAGGAVLIGGGVWAYSKYRKDKSYKNYWQNDTNFLPPLGANPPPPGGSGGTPPGGGIPPGAKLILTSSVSGVSVGNAFTVSLSLVDANGTVQSQVSSLQVEASCLTPNPCSLDGAKSVTLMGGNVTFSGLKFNQGDRGVTLQFSAPGVANVTTPGTFDVSGGAGRQ